MKSFLLIAALTLVTSTITLAQSLDDAEVLKVEEELRVAQLANDIATLGRITHRNFYSEKGSSEKAVAAMRPILECVCSGLVED